MIRPSSSESRSASIGPQSFDSFPPLHVAAGDEHREDFSRRILLLLIISFSGLGATHYVDINSANPAPPYISWASAATNIQDAIDASVAGDDVVVTNGVYATGGRPVYGALTNRVSVTKPITLRSVNGPNVTIIQGAQSPGGGVGAGAVRCVYLTNGAALIGFTLTNGYSTSLGDYVLEQSGGGVWCESSSVVVSDCVLIGNAGRYGGGAYSGTLYSCTLVLNAAGSGAGAHSATLNNCAISDNYAGFQGCGLASCVANNSRITGHVGDSAAYQSTLNNCVLTGNHSLFGTGAASESTLNNCSVAGNSTDCYCAGGVYHCVLNNSIVYANTGAFANYDGTSTFNYCSTTPQPSSGLGNIALDPAFVNLEAGDLRLQFYSPCIDAGLNAYAPGPTDINGDPRIVTGTVDMGAYEFQGPRTAATHYVAADSPNPVAPYDSWATSAKTIQDAIDAAAVGDDILVTNGVYETGGRAVYGTMTNRIAVDKPVFVHSVNGPSFTTILGHQVPLFINGASAIRCAYLTNGARLAGFTLRNGATHDTGADYMEQSGGGVYCEGSGAAVFNCVVTDNSALVYGGGILYGTLYNCAIFANRAGAYGAGTYNSALNNCTVTGNSATEWGGGADGGTINNSIVYFNTPYNFSWDTVLNYCCTTPSPYNGSHNITANPQLASPTHLSANSPCRGAGNSAYAFEADIDGELWAAPPSIGCDEYHAGAVTGPLTVDLRSTFTNVIPGYAVGLTALIDGRTSASTWDFGDGTTSTNQPYAAHAWATLGDYVVVLRAFNESNPEGIAASLTIHVGTPPVHYVAIDNPTPELPYSSWATAATNIQDAVDVATVPGALVVVSNGVYTVGERRISGQTNRVAVYKLLDSTVVGNTATQEGGGLWSTNGDIKNSIIYYNNAPSGSNWVGGVGRFDGLLLYWCCSAPLPVGGIGNIADAPRFVDFAAGNLRLQSNSPCIDAGNKDFVFGATDLDGRPRTVGGTVDIGAYEFQPGVNGQFIGWLQQYSLPTDGSADYTDPDGDDRNDWQEWQCQTIPTNALSVLRMVSATQSLNDVKVIWESVAGVNYFIERSTNLASVPPFVLLSTNIAGQASTTSYLDVGAAGASPPFYRVGVSN